MIQVTPLDLCKEKKSTGEGITEGKIKNFLLKIIATTMNCSIIYLFDSQDFEVFLSRENLANIPSWAISSFSYKLS